MSKRRFEVGLWWTHKLACEAVFVIRFVSCDNLRGLKLQGARAGSFHEELVFWFICQKNMKTNFCLEFAASVFRPGGLLVH